jgi:response regulator RpfG family c-di-GMP phosphodiesterase
MNNICNNKNILFVDDETEFLMSIKRVLRRNEYNIYTAIDSIKAINIMHVNSIEILVSDIKMPDMSGLDLLRYVKDRYPNTLRIALSAVTEHEEVLTCINSAEVFRYLIKPIDPSGLRRELDNAFKRLSLRRRRVALVEDLLRENREYRWRVDHLVEAGDLQQELVSDLLEAMDRMRPPVGMVPVCSFCKRVRDEDDNWHEMEHYVREFLKVEFSHGVCSECVRKHYSGYCDGTDS